MKKITFARMLGIALVALAVLLIGFATNDLLWALSMNNSIEYGGEFVQATVAALLVLPLACTFLLARKENIERMKTAITCTTIAILTPLIVGGIIFVIDYAGKDSLALGVMLVFVIFPLSIIFFMIANVQALMIVAKKK